MSRRSVLFVHQNFPGQFPRIAQALVKRGDRVAAIGSHTARNMPGVDVRRWRLTRGTTLEVLPEAVRAEADLLRADCTLRTAVDLARDGFTPDVIVANPGWGEPLHLKELWPRARLILLVEYWYAASGGTVGFDLEHDGEAPSLERAANLNARNFGQALACTLADIIVCPTRFQASLFPLAIRDRIIVHHEGIDRGAAMRRADAKLNVANGVTLRDGDPVVTFISRTLEPLRGFHSFMRALPELQTEMPTAQVVIIGSDDQVGYGQAPPSGSSWKQVMLKELDGQLDLARIHFLGRVEHKQMISALSISAAHVYFTYPFALSWSILEAMNCGCLVIGSDTPPVRDVITAGQNGLLVDFFDTKALSARLAMVLKHPAAFASLRSAAQQTVADRFDGNNGGIAGWLKLID